MKKKPETTTYSATGCVWGNLWGGGRGGYPSKTLTAGSMKALRAEALKMLANGSLDGGMGYESLVGALLTVTRIRRRIIGGREYVNMEHREMRIGKLDADVVGYLRQNI